MNNCEILSNAQSWQYEVAPEFFLRGIDMRRPDRATIHFLHGVAFAGKVYWPLLKPLTENYGLFTQDFQGHGESDLGGEFCGWQGTVAQVQAVIENKQVIGEGRPVVGLGHSYGASLSLIMAAANPTLFAGLVLLDPMIFPQEMLDMLATVKPEDNPMTSRIADRVSGWSSREEAKYFFASKKAFCDWREDALECFLDYTLEEDAVSGEVTLICPPSLEAQFVANPLDSIWQAVRTVAIPTIIIHSSAETSPIRESCVNAAKLNPNIKAIEVKGGHNFMQEFPQETLELVKTCLQDLGV